MVPLGTSTATISEVGAEDQDALSAPGLHVEFPSLNLPPDFTQRIRSLLANTLLHIPSSSRLRTIAAVVQCWQGMAHCLEEGRSELLLAPGLPGLGADS